MHNFLSFILAFALFAAPASARQLTPTEYVALNAVVEKYIADMEKMEMRGITDAIPSRIINDISGPLGMDPKQYRHIMAVQMKGSMSQLTSLSIDVDMTDPDVTDAQNTDGMKAAYVLLPYIISTNVKGKPVSASSLLIAIHENKKWWLTRVSPNQADRLIRLYPFLKNVEF